MTRTSINLRSAIRSFTVGLRTIWSGENRNIDESGPAGTLGRLGEKLPKTPPANGRKIRATLDRLRSRNLVRDLPEIGS